MTLRLIVGSLAFALGAWISFLNWTVLWIQCVQKRRSPSWTPLLGAVLMALGLLSCPRSDVRGAWWLPFLLDWGSAPGLVTTLVFHWRRRER